jgi:hypothetical protein
MFSSIPQHLDLEGTPSHPKHEDILNSIRDRGKVYPMYLNLPNIRHTTTAAKISFFTDICYKRPSMGLRSWARVFAFVGIETCIGGMSTTTSHEGRCKRVEPYELISGSIQRVAFDHHRSIV